MLPRLVLLSVFHRTIGTKYTTQRLYRETEGLDLSVLEGADIKGYIDNNLKNLNKLNYVPLLSKTEADSRRLMGLPLTLIEFIVLK